MSLIDQFMEEEVEEFGDQADKVMDILTRLNKSLNNAGELPRSEDVNKGTRACNISVTV